ncbi:YdcF family protein [Vagococcus sp.]|uniref:YdcF family protein n=1 Tax=Vagococcus sp. TaxID=1933889 RepID=UPI003F9DF55C
MNLFPFLRLVVLFVIPLFLFLLWIIKKPTSLWTGFWGLVLLGGTYLTIVLELERWNTKIAIWVAMPGILLLGLFTLFGTLGIVIYLFWNEGVLLKKEGFRLANLLPLIIALILIFFEVGLVYFAYQLEHPFVTMLASFLIFCFSYGVSVFIMYTLTSIFYNLYPIRKPIDYIIILGAGLIDGERVTPLLASRIEAGLALYDRQKKKLGHEAVIIVSGGQGPDEKISEAQAMKNYLDEQKRTDLKVLLETESINTRQNLEFSEKIIKKDSSDADINDLNLVIATNNYHLLRAGKLARKIGLFARGVGSKTKAYYLPTAFIREYIGYLEMSKSKHLSVLFLALILSLILFFLFI